jgi:hypothetical protein
MNAEEAMRRPEEWREKTVARMTTVSGKLDLELPPYSIARIDNVE